MKIMEILRAENKGLWILVLLFAGMVGALMGSFFNCAAFRKGRGETVRKGRSHCVFCGHVLAAWDLIPIVSWLWRRGRCAYCGRRISPRYPVTELISSVMWMVCVLRFDLTIYCLGGIVFSCALFYLLLVNEDCGVISLPTLLTLLVFSIGFSLFRKALLAKMFFAELAAALLLLLFRNRRRLVSGVILLLWLGMAAAGSSFFM